MRPAFIILALSAFAVARPFGNEESSSSHSVTTRSEDLLKGLTSKLAGTLGLATAAVDHLKDAAHGIVGDACSQLQSTLAVRSLDITDFNDNVEIVAQATYQQLVDDRALEDSPENYAIIKDLLSVNVSQLLGKGCDKVQAILASRGVDGVDGEDKLFGPSGRIQKTVKAVHAFITGTAHSRPKGGKVAPAPAPALAPAAAGEPVAEAVAEPAADDTA